LTRDLLPVMSDNPPFSNYVPEARQLPVSALSAFADSSAGGTTTITRNEIPSIRQDLTNILTSRGYEENEVYRVLNRFTPSELGSYEGAEDYLASVIETERTQRQRSGAGEKEEGR
jgi:hypothetical protein